MVVIYQAAVGMDANPGAKKSPWFMISAAIAWEWGGTGEYDRFDHSMLLWILINAVYGPKIVPYPQLIDTHKRNSIYTLSLFH